METYSYDHSGDEVDRRAGQDPRPDGIYSLPVVGSTAGRVRGFYDQMAPRETDSTEVRVAKEVFRWGSVVTGAAAIAVVVL